MILRLTDKSNDEENDIVFEDNFNSLEAVVYSRKKCKCIYDGENYQIVLKDKKYLSDVNILFDTDIVNAMEDKVLYVSLVYFFNTDTEESLLYACLPDSVVLLDDDENIIESF